MKNICKFALSGFVLCAAVSMAMEPAFSKEISSANNVQEVNPLDTTTFGHEYCSPCRGCV